MVKKYTPVCGDIVWLDFDPIRGHEQAGLRPAYIVSPETYNSLLGLCLACPITKQVKGYPFEVAYTGKKVKGVILADQVRSIDWNSRHCKFVERADDATIVCVAEFLKHLVSYSD
ncbi:MAG: endoribonuclease MazF [Patescibacteria group bacterium]